jgi:WD40 repeat protein
LAFSPDGTTLAEANDDGTVTLWDHAKRTRRATLTASGGISTAIAFSPDGDVLASGSSGGALVLWDAAGRSRMATLAPVAHDRTMHPVDALAFSPDGSTLAVAQPTAPPDIAEEPDDSHTHLPIALWDVRRRALTGFVDTTESSTVFTLAFSPDGDRFAVGSTSGVEIMDVSNGFARSAPSMRYDGAPVTSLAFTPESDTLAINEEGAAITLLDPSARQIVSGARIRRMAVHPHGSLMATMGDGPDVELWDIADKQRIKTFASLGNPDGDITFSPSGNYAAWTGWDTVALHPVRHKEDSQTLRIVRRPEGTRAPVAGGPRSVGFSDESQRVFVADSYHEMVLVWEPRGPPTKKRIPGLRTAALSPDGDVLATATSRGVLLWSFPDLTELGELGSLERFQDEPHVTFSDDGSTLGTVDAEVVTLWDARKRTPITSFTEDARPIDIAIAPDNRTVALAFEGSVAIWDAAERVRIADNLPLAFSYDNQVVFHDNGARVAATNLDTIQFWDLGPYRAITGICSTLDRSLTREEWAEFLPRESYRATCA